MGTKYTVEQLNSFSRRELIMLLLSQQEQLNKMNDSFERLTEQIRIANQQRFGRHTEKLSEIPGQLSFFNEAEQLSESMDESQEPDPDDVLPQKPKAKKQKGKRDADLKDFPREVHEHVIAAEELDKLFGAGNWREMPVEECKRLRYEPASWTVEEHKTHVYVGTGGDHQDEFLRADRPKDLLRNSILTPSLGAAIMNAKYVNAIPINRIEQEFSRNGLNLSRQVMAGWIIKCSERYFQPLYDRLKEKLFEFPVNQSDETPVEVIKDGRPAGSQSYMWVHRSGELYREHPVVLYEYQKTRNSIHPKEFYKDYKGILMTDGLEQYHKIARELDGLTNANCWAHARRSFADAVKAIGKNNEQAAKLSTAYQALTRIAAIYKLEGTLKNLSAEERLRERQASIKPLVDEYFAWVKERLTDTTCLPKGKTAEGLKYSVNQEEYLRVFLTNGDVPIDNSASERSIRAFTVGRKNWVFIYSTKGAETSAVVYSITETAKLNNLNPYYYLKYILEELPQRMDVDGHIDPHDLDDLLPWSDSLPTKCHKVNR
ncbi:MAG: IS66 family transposase [Escherichia coli]|nr:IS66 family transposase [Escherichia coli]